MNEEWRERSGGTRLDVTNEEYVAFYRALSHDVEDHLSEAFQLKNRLSSGRCCANDLFETNNNIKLHVRRVAS